VKGGEKEVGVGCWGLREEWDVVVYERSRADSQDARANTTGCRLRSRHERRQRDDAPFNTYVEKGARGGGTKTGTKKQEATAIKKIGEAQQ
jgi:hypothetical protein